jgi:hypothetical protein
VLAATWLCTKRQCMRLCYIGGQCLLPRAVACARASCAHPLLANP